MKRITAFLMAVMIFFQMVPMTKAVAGEATLEGLVTQQYDDFVYKLTGGSVKDATDRLVNHSIKGSSKLTMGQNDTFTKALLSTKMFRASFIHAATTAIEHMQGTGEDKLFMRGGINWYDKKSLYTNVVYLDNENGDESDDPVSSPRIAASQNPYTGSFNSHDESMILVVGGSYNRLTFRRTSITEDTATYHVSVKIFDRFDFNGADYSNVSGGLAQMINWLGMLLSFGLLNEFDWTATAELTLTVPNSCTHSSANYRWEFDGKQDLVSVTTNGNTNNPLTRIAGTTENGIFSKTKYTIEKPMRMYHDRPWVLEMKCQGTGFLIPGGTYDSGTKSAYIRKAANTLFFHESAYLNEGDEKKTLTQYGIWFTGRKEIAVSSADDHTYRLDNRIAEDGTNMVYLSIDGVELGPMIQFYCNGTKQKTDSDWLCGKDFSFNYYGNNSYSVDDIYIDYIQLWENGEGNAPFTYCATKQVAPTCTSDGYTQNTCTLCGAVFKTDAAPATGHSFDAYTSNSDATCTADGTKTAKCSTCGTTDTVADPGTARNHSFGTWALTKSATCTAEGEERRDCKNCDHYETRSLAQRAHEWINAVTAEPSCTENGIQEKTCRNCDALEVSEIPAAGHSWADAAVPMKHCTACGYRESSCQIQLPAELSGMETVWLDGVAFPVEDGDVTLGSTASCLTVYEPEMQIYELNWTGESYETNHIPELDGLMVFAGTDLRTEGIPGIRIITAMDRETREALQGDGLAGYTLVETGTVTSFAETSLVLGQPETKSNHAYRKGEADPIYKKTKDQILYTNVLVGYSPRQYDTVLSIRPYCVLEKDGQQLTVYGKVLRTTIAQLIEE